MGIISRWRARREARKKTTTTTTGSYQGPMPSGTTATQEATFRATGTTTTSGGGGGGSYQGPVQPGVDVQTFRETGVSTPIKSLYQGPVQPGVDVQTFRETGFTGKETKAPTQLKVLSSGGVKVGGTKYIGQAIVPYTGGKTANIIQAETFAKARKQGIKKRGTYSATIPIAQQQVQTFEQSQQSAGQLLWGEDGLVQPALIPIEEGGSLYQTPVVTGAKGFFGRVKQRGQEEYTLLKEGTRGISGTYGGTYLPPPPYGSYVKGFFQEIPSSFPGIKTAGQDVKEFFQPQIKTAQIGLGVIKTTAGKVTETKPYQSFKEWNAPRMEAVTSSTEFEVLSKSVVRGTAFTPARIVGRQVFTETIPLRQRKQPYAIENIETTIYKGKPYRYSDYTIYTEKAPPRLQVTRKIYEKPIDITYLPSVKSTTRTPFKASSTDSFITAEMKSGRVASLSEVTGTSQAIELQSILSYQKLSAPKRLLVQRLAESKAGGTPVTGKWIQKMMKEDNQRFFSQIDVTKLGKSRLTPSGVQLESLPIKKLGLKRYDVQMGSLKYKEFYKEPYYSYPFGKTTTRYEAITETKLLKETEMYDFSKSKVLFKDVTYPNVRATGKTPELTVYSYEKKIPNIIDDFKDIQVIRPSDINDLKRTSLGKTFQVQVPKQPTIFAPPKVSKAISTTKIVSSSMQSSQNLIPTSAFYGKGLYERTTGGQLPGVQLPSTTSYSYSPVTTTTYTPSAVSTTQFTIIKPSYKFDTREISRGMNKEIAKEMVKEIQKPMLKETLKVIQKPATKLILKQYQKSTSKVPQRIVTGIPTRITPRIKTPYPPPKIKQFKQPKNIFGTYKVYGRRFGEYKVVGVAKDPLGAVGIGKKWARQTLGVSFKVPGFKGGKVSGFRTKKEKGETIFIEPRGKRIKRGTKEIPELQYWKGVKSPVKPPKIIKERKLLFFKKKDGKYGFV